MSVRVVRGDDVPFPAGWFLAAVFVIVLCALLLTSCRTVAEGDLGVKTRAGAATGEVLTPGYHLVFPVVEGVESMPVRTLLLKGPSEAASIDSQQVTTEVAVNYRLDRERIVPIWRDLRTGWQALVLEPAFHEAVKASTAQLRARDLIANRNKVKEILERELSQRVSGYGIIIENVNFTNFDFSKTFNDAIEAEQTADVRAKQAEFETRRAVEEAKQNIERARGEAESIRIRSDALANSPKLVEWEAIQKWDGKLPQFTGGAIPFINVAATSTTAR